MSVFNTVCLCNTLNFNDLNVQLNQVWLSCQGESPADVENIGRVDYYPGPGFPGYFFPYENSEGYLSPLVAVHLTNPRRKYIKPIKLQFNI